MNAIPVLFRAATLRRILTLFLCLSLLPATCAIAENFSKLPPFTVSDRILILAPHPDDETIAAGGVIQRAVKAGAKMKVVLLTNGENNLSSFMRYDKRFFFGPKRIIRMGDMRKQETVTAMQSLGLTDHDVISLGYPDNGTLEIMTNHWGETSQAEGEFSHANRVPYSDALSFGAAYTGENILKDIKQILLDYKPTMIFVSHPADKNPDHQALYLFLKVAMLDLESKIDEPSIFFYLVHAGEWPLPQEYRPDLALTAPPSLAGMPLSWYSLNLSAEEVSKKYRALHDYPSQQPGGLAFFARKNELFSTYPDIKIGQVQGFTGISYTRDGDRLFVRFQMKRTWILWRKASIFLLGYKKGTSFSVMPKIEIAMRMGRAYVNDKKIKLSNKDIEVTRQGKQLIVSIPLSLLENPELILANIKTNRKDVSHAQKSWRVLRLD